MGPFPHELAEDLVFFYRHIESGGTLKRVDQVCLQYQCHDGQSHHKIHKDYLRRIRAAAFERQILEEKSAFFKPRFDQGFSIWGAGRDGLAFYR